MNDFGRIAVCGGIATYNDKAPQTGSMFFINLNILFIYYFLNSKATHLLKKNHGVILLYYTREQCCVNEIVPFLPFRNWILFTSLTSFLLSGPYPHLTMICKQLKMEGFMQGRWAHKDPESLKRLMGWVKEVSEWLEKENALCFDVTFHLTKLRRCFASWSCSSSVCRVNCRVGNMSQKVLKTCQLPLWGYCVGKTPARPSSQCKGWDQSNGSFF